MSERVLHPMTGPRRPAVTFLLALAVATVPSRALAQQFNTDNYLSMPYGTATFLITHGTRNSTVVTSFALAPNWEFFAVANLFWERGSDETL